MLVGTLAALALLAVWRMWRRARGAIAPAAAERDLLLRTDAPRSDGGGPAAALPGALIGCIATAAARVVGCPAAYGRYVCGACAALQRACVPRSACGSSCCGGGGGDGDDGGGDDAALKQRMEQGRGTPMTNEGTFTPFAPPARAPLLDDERGGPPTPPPAAAVEAATPASAGGDDEGNVARVRREIDWYGAPPAATAAAAVRPPPVSAPSPSAHAPVATPPAGGGWGWGGAQERAAAPAAEEAEHPWPRAFQPAEFTPPAALSLTPPPGAAPSASPLGHRTGARGFVCGVGGVSSPPSTVQGWPPHSAYANSDYTADAAAARAARARNPTSSSPIQLLGASGSPSSGQMLMVQLDNGGAAAVPMERHPSSAVSGDLSRVLQAAAWEAQGRQAGGVGGMGVGVGGMGVGVGGMGGGGSGALMPGRLAEVKSQLRAVLVETRSHPHEVGKRSAARRFALQASVEAQWSRHWAQVDLGALLRDTSLAAREMLASDPALLTQVAAEVRTHYESLEAAYLYYVGACADDAAVADAVAANAAAARDAAERQAAGLVRTVGGTMQATPYGRPTACSTASPDAARASASLPSGGTPPLWRTLGLEGWRRFCADVGLGDVCDLSWFAPPNDVEAAPSAAARREVGERALFQSVVDRRNALTRASVASAPRPRGGGGGRGRRQPCHCRGGRRRPCWRGLPTARPRLPRVCAGAPPRVLEARRHAGGRRASWWPRRVDEQGRVGVVVGLAHGARGARGPRACRPAARGAARCDALPPRARHLRHPPRGVVRAAARPPPHLRALLRAGRRRRVRRRRALARRAAAAAVGVAQRCRRDPRWLWAARRPIGAPRRRVGRPHLSAGDAAAAFLPRSARTRPSPSTMTASSRW